MNLLAKNTALAFSVFIVSQAALSLNWEKEKIFKDDTIVFGVGAAGSVAITPYGSATDPEYFIAKKFRSYPVDKFVNPSSFDKSKKNMLVNEICANKELYGSSLITSAFSVYFSQDETGKEQLHMAMEPMLGNSVDWAYEYMEMNPEQFDIAWIKLMLARTALAIDHMHKKGWAWFDVQGKNIFIDHNTGLTKIGDFGEGKRIDDMVSDKRSYLRDWLMFGKYLIYATRYIAKNITMDKPGLKAFLDDLDEALKKLQLDNKDEPGEIQSLEQLKKLNLFKDFNWQAAANGTAKSNFIPSQDLNYLKFILDKQDDLVKKIHSRSLKTLKPQSFDQFILDPAVISAVNKIKAPGSKEIKSVDDFCLVMDPRRNK